MKLLPQLLLILTCLGIAAISLGCNSEAPELRQLYDRDTFERGTIGIIERSNFSVTELWANAEQWAPIPEDVFALHNNPDENGKRRTVYLIAESEDDTIFSVRYWVINGRVGALTIFSTHEETARMIKSGFERHLSGLVIETKISDDDTVVRDAGSGIGGV